MTNRRQEFGQGFRGMLEISIHHPDHISLGGLPSFHDCRGQALATRASQHANWQFATQFFCYIGSAIRTGVIDDDQFKLFTRSRESRGSAIENSRNRCGFVIGGQNYPHPRAAIVPGAASACRGSTR